MTIDIAGHQVGPGNPCFIIAEAGVNHNGDLDLAKQLVDAAAQANADAVKFQTFKAENLVSPQAPKAEYQVETTGAEHSQLDMIRNLEFSPEAFVELQAYSHERGIVFISTPFDHESVDLLASMNVPAFKIPSGETVNLPLIRHVASKGKPMILSTGMSYLGEVERAVHTIRETGNDKLVVLHCVSNYPASAQDVNLKAMGTIAQSFQVPVGYSDHTLGLEVPLAAVALGACVIEKHFTLDRNMPGPDHRASLEPDELTALVAGIRTVEQSLGSGEKKPAKSEMKNRQVIRRSVYLRRDVEAGSVLTEDDLILLRPADGIAPEHYDEVLGRQVRRALAKGTALSWNNLE